MKKFMRIIVLIGLVLGGLTLHPTPAQAVEVLSNLDINNPGAFFTISGDQEVGFSFIVRGNDYRINQLDIFGDAQATNTEPSNTDATVQATLHQYAGGSAPGTSIASLGTDDHHTA